MRPATLRRLRGFAGGHQGAHAAGALAVALPDPRMPSNEPPRFAALGARWTLDGIGSFDVGWLKRVSDDPGDDAAAAEEWQEEVDLQYMQQHAVLPSMLAPTESYEDDPERTRRRAEPGYAESASRYTAEAFSPNALEKPLSE